MNQTEIDELRRLASVSREPRHGIGCIASDCALASAARNALPRLLAALEEARAEADLLEGRCRVLAADSVATSKRLAEARSDQGGLLECIVAMLVAAGAPPNINGIEEAVSAVGNRPSDFIRFRMKTLGAERDALRAKLAALVGVVESLGEIYPDTEGLPEAADGEPGKRWEAVAMAIESAKVQPCKGGTPKRRVADGGDWTGNSEPIQEI